MRCNSHPYSVVFHTVVGVVVVTAGILSKMLALIALVANTYSFGVNEIIGDTGIASVSKSEIAAFNIRPSCAARYMHEVPAVEAVAMIRLRRLPCPFDFVPASLRAFDYAVKLAAPYDAAVHALHVVSPVMGAAMVVSPGARELTPEYEKQSKHLLQALKTKTARAGLGIETELRRSIETHKPDHLVMATHGRRTFERAVRAASEICSVLLIPTSKLTTRKVRRTNP